MIQELKIKEKNKKKMKKKITQTKLTSLNHDSNSVAGPRVHVADPIDVG